MFCVTVPQTCSMYTQVCSNKFVRMLSIMHCSHYLHHRLKLSRICWMLRSVTSVMESTVGAAMLHTPASTVSSTIVNNAGPMFTFLETSSITPIIHEETRIQTVGHVRYSHVCCRHVWYPRLQIQADSPPAPPPPPLQTPHLVWLSTRSTF